MEATDCTPLLESPFPSGGPRSGSRGQTEARALLNAGRMGTSLLALFGGKNQAWERPRRGNVWGRDTLVIETTKWGLGSKMCFVLASEARAPLPTFWESIENGGWFAEGAS